MALNIRSDLINFSRGACAIIAQNAMALLFWSGPALAAHRPNRCREVLPLAVAPHRTGQFAESRAGFV
jgi:hypothetical protein